MGDLSYTIMMIAMFVGLALCLRAVQGWLNRGTAGSQRHSAEFDQPFAELPQPGERPNVLDNGGRRAGQ
jgi:hypothetical protein